MHASAALIWLMAATLAIWNTRNPLYLTLALMAVWAVFRAAPDSGPRPVSPLRLLLIGLPLSAVLNALAVRAGDTPLFRLPDALPLIGGAITLEATVFGALNALMLCAVYAAFAAFGLIAPATLWLRRAPAALRPAASVLSVALTFAPSLQRQAGLIREAQAARGQTFRGLRDWPALLLPLLTSSLERALDTAEAMSARGYGGQVVMLTPVRRIAMWAGLALLSLAALLPTGNLIALAAGIGLVAAALRTGTSDSVRPTRWRTQRWTHADTLGVATSIGVLALLWLRIDVAAWSPYPALSMPGFDVWSGLAYAFLAAPLLALQRPVGGEA
jgi:energy-coupling factor transport system permease protein